MWPVAPEPGPCQATYLHSLLGKLVQSGSLDLEDVGVGLQQVLPLHALLPGHGAHQDSSIAVLEGLLGVGGGEDLCRRRRGQKWNFFQTKRHSKFIWRLNIVT